MAIDKAEWQYDSAIKENSEFKRQKNIDLNAVG